MAVLSKPNRVHIWALITCIVILSGCAINLSPSTTVDWQDLTPSSYGRIEEITASTTVAGVEVVAGGSFPHKPWVMKGRIIVIGSRDDHQKMAVEEAKRRGCDVIVMEKPTHVSSDSISGTVYRAGQYVSLPAP